MLSKYLDLEPIYKLYKTYYKLTDGMFKKGLNQYEYNYIFNPYKFLYPYFINFRYHHFELKEQVKMIKNYDKLSVNYNIPYYKYISKNAFIINELNVKYNLFKKINNVLEITTEEILTDALYYIKPDANYTLLSYKGNGNDKDLTLYNSLIFNSTIINNVEQLDKKYDFVLLGDLYPKNFNDVGIIWEENRSRILIYNLYHALKNLNINGNIVIDLIEIKTDFTLSLIYYLSEKFKSIYLHSTEPNLNSINRVTNNYLICKGYKSSKIEQLKKIIKKYKISEDSFNTYFVSKLKNYYRAVFPSCKNKNNCIIENSYIEYIKPDCQYFKDKQNYPNKIVEMKGKKLKKIVKIVNDYNRVKSHSQIQFINFIIDNINYNKSFLNKFNKKAEEISHQYCIKYKIKTK